jgi:predicted nucleic acid-binding protein
MSSPVSKIAVQDANVLIDLEIAGLLDLWFQTGIETHTTDLIRAEQEKGGHAQAVACFKCGQVIEHGLSFEEIMAVSELEREVGSKAKFNDCSVLFLALKLDAMLLSGDKALRKAGREKRIEVHGTLWIFDQLVERQLITSRMAAAKLEHLRRQDRFLPEAECEIRLNAWRGI